MAYQPYPYGGYQPNPYYPGPVPDQLAQLRQNQQMQNMQQPMIQPQPIVQQPIQPSQQPQQESTGIIWVQGEAGAKAYMVAPGNTVQLWDSEDTVIYLKSADMSGMPSMRILDYTERGGAPAQKQGPQTQLDLSQYVRRDELTAEVREAVEDFLSEKQKRPIKSAKAKEEQADG